LDDNVLISFSSFSRFLAHDRYFIERFAEEIWWVENGRIRRS
jgi:ATPase subunit of ABC transporter with duplicated ATPase domains